MQYRQLPPAGGVDDIEAVFRAVPVDPADTADCCGRVCDRTVVESREHASQWLVFLTALGCVTDDGAGYYRSVDELDSETLGTQFESRVFGVPAVLDVLERTGRPLTRDEVFSRLEDGTRRRLERSDPEYLDRLLGWAVVFERASVTEAGFVAETD